MRLPSIRPAETNPKEHHGDGIRASLVEHGLAESPLLDERTGRLIAGHGRIDQLRDLAAAGGTPPDDVHVDVDGVWLVPVQRGWASKSAAHAKAYLAASNQLTIAGGWDLDALGVMLLDVDEAGLLDASGFDRSELDAILHVDDEPGDGLGDGDGPDEGAAAFGVIVVVGSEPAQDALLRKLQGQGHHARTLAAARVKYDRDDG
ncbi:hypothetical protein [Dactylosporangium sp. CS-033363]|uniref:hypothetical protein n=1 Tax=Dactylosporangium sp. CS-033363 TaxID=3239935 RepID=UPI003D937D91